MQNAFEIKGIRIGDGQPVICVPVVALKKEKSLQISVFWRNKRCK